MRILIPGGVSGHFGAQFIQLGRDLRFLARAPHFAQPRSICIQIATIDGNTLAVPRPGAGPPVRNRPNSGRRDHQGT
jgi:hypothetical protein